MLPGIYAATASGTVTVADYSGEFSSFGSPDINDSGMIAFAAVLDSGRRGIYTGADPATSEIIGGGDELFGSTLWEVGFLTSA